MRFWGKTLKKTLAREREEGKNGAGKQLPARELEDGPKTVWAAQSVAHLRICLQGSATRVAPPPPAAPSPPCGLQGPCPPPTLQLRLPAGDPSRVRLLQGTRWLPVRLPAETRPPPVAAPPCSCSRPPPCRDPSASRRCSSLQPPQAPKVSALPCPLLLPPARFSTPCCSPLLLSSALDDRISEY